MCKGAASADDGGEDVGRSADGAPAPGRNRSVNSSADGLAGALIGAKQIEPGSDFFMKGTRITARSHVAFVQTLFRRFALVSGAIKHDRPRLCGILAINA